MRPHEPAGPGEPTDPLPIAQVSPGMSVVDAAGREVGVVSAVQQPGTGIRPDAPVADEDRLLATGYLRIDAAGLGSADVYAGGEEVAGVSAGHPGVVTLAVRRDALTRAG